MPQCLANGLGVLEAQLCLPSAGVWHARLALDTAEAVQGAVTIDTGAGLVLKGTVRRAGVYNDVAQVHVVGGAGGLGKLASGQGYQQTTLGLVLQDLARQAGEQLAGTIDNGLLQRRLIYWHVPQQPVGLALKALVRSAGADVVRRVLPDGTLWVGVPTWPAATLEGYAVEREHPEEGLLVLATEGAQLDAGTTLDGQRVQYVEHLITPRQVRSTVWFA